MHNNVTTSYQDTYIPLNTGAGFGNFLKYTFIYLYNEENLPHEYFCLITSRPEKLKGIFCQFKSINDPFFFFFKTVDRAWNHGTVLEWSMYVCVVSITHKLPVGFRGKKYQLFAQIAALQPFYF